MDLSRGKRIEDGDETMGKGRHSGPGYHWMVSPGGDESVNMSWVSLGVKPFEERNKCIPSTQILLLVVVVPRPGLQDL